MHFTMPVPPLPSHEYFSYYQVFVRAMNNVPATAFNQMLRIHQAIDKTAEETESSPAFVARLLVAFGLQAPKKAFPKEFVTYVETRDTSIQYFQFERSDYLDDLALLWEYEAINRTDSSSEEDTKVDAV